MPRRTVRSRAARRRGQHHGRVNYYDDHTDNYLQINNQLLVNHRFNERWHMNLTGFYTYGYGFYKAV